MIPALWHVWREAYFMKRISSSVAEYFHSWKRADDSGLIIYNQHTPCISTTQGQGAAPPLPPF